MSQKTLTDAVRSNLERYRKLGAAVDGPEGPMFMAPFAAPGSEDATPGPERDVAFLGLRLSDYPARTVAGVSRLEELRGMAARAGIPEELLRDDTQDGVQGFADRLMTLTASDESRDRYGDRILTDGTLQVGKDPAVPPKKFGKGWQLDTYVKKNPVFMAFHQYAPSMSGWPYAGIPLGTCLDAWTETKGKRKRLRQTVLWDTGAAQPIAPNMMASYRSRGMRSFSVGFVPEKSYSPQDNDERAELDLGPYGCIYGQCELLEVSAVAIPANPNCTDEKMVEDLLGFADGVQDAAPELAYQIRSWAPNTRTSVQIPAEVRGVVPHDVSDKKADIGEAWKAPSLKDFTSKAWGDLSEAEKTHIAGHFAWAASVPPATYGDLKLPHHRASDGAVVFRGVSAAAGRLGKTAIPSADKAKVRAHLGRHYKAFDKVAPWDEKDALAALMAQEEAEAIADADERAGAKPGKPMKPACSACGGQNLDCRDCGEKMSGKEGEKPEKAFREVPGGQEALVAALETIEQACEAIEDLIGLQEPGEPPSTAPAANVGEAVERIEMAVEAIEALAGIEDDEDDDEEGRSIEAILSRLLDARGIVATKSGDAGPAADPLGLEAKVEKLTTDLRTLAGILSPAQAAPEKLPASGEGSKEDLYDDVLRASEETLKLLK